MKSTAMDRAGAIRELQNGQPWDVVVIGGGATGLGTAVDAASRGYRTLLVEQHDFAKCTSSRSTKLVHGGVRYLRQGNVRLVLEALHERELLMRNAPHLVHPLSFLVPVYRWWEAPFYGVGMKLYDMLAGRLGVGRTRLVSRRRSLELISTLEGVGLHGGVCYQDGQFDDSRLAINLAQTVWDHGGFALNYAPVTGLLKSGGRVCGVRLRDEETGAEHEVQAKAVVNATGVFCDEVRLLDDPETTRMVALSQGAHVVLPRDFLPGETALMVPSTSDGRVLFAIPWHDRVVVGTTDTPLPTATLEPKPFEDEIDFILRTAGEYLTRKPHRGDVLSAYAGLRPLVQKIGAKSTAAMPRDHTVMVSDSGLVTVTGGKWTTYRKMAEDTVNRAEQVADFAPRTCVTETLAIHGASAAAPGDSLDVYGADAAAIRKMLDADPAMGARLHASLPYVKAEVIWSARNEMARSVEDVLSRRTRALLLDARASIEAAPMVASLMAAELRKDAEWEQRQVNEYRQVAERYLL